MPLRVLDFESSASTKFHHSGRGAVGDDRADRAAPGHEKGSVPLAGRQSPLSLFGAHVQIGRRRTVKAAEAPPGLADDDGPSTLDSADISPPIKRMKALSRYCTTTCQASAPTPSGWYD